MPAIGDFPFVTTQFLDYSGERKSMRNIVKTWDEDTLDAFLSQWDTYNTALANITLGTPSHRAYGVDSVVSNTRPADKTAQIETELLVTYIDDTTEAPYSVRIPTADYAAFNYASPPAGDEVIISGAGASAATTAFINAAVAIWRSPLGNSVTITGMRVVR